MANPVARDNLLQDLAVFPREQAIHDADAAVEDLNVGAVNAVRDPARSPLGGGLEALAWERAVVSWDATWSEATKRAVVVAAPEVHRHLGTRYAVQTALSALGVDAQINEWWQTAPQGLPYTFSVVLTAHAPVGNTAILTDRLIRNAYAAIMRAKPESRAFGMRITGQVGTVAGSTIGIAVVGRVRYRPGRAALIDLSKL